MKNGFNKMFLWPTSSGEAGWSELPLLPLAIHAWNSLKGLTNFTTLRLRSECITSATSIGNTFLCCEM